MACCEPESSQPNALVTEKYREVSCILSILSQSLTVSLSSKSPFSSYTTGQEFFDISRYLTAT
jgi:hypothetical protein